MSACFSRGALRRLAELAGRRVVVLGFARTGRSTARLLAEVGTEVVVVEDAPGVDAACEAEAIGAVLVVSPGRERLAALVRSAELIVVSPGVAPTHPLFGIAKAHAVRVVSEVELAACVAEVPILAITGTNGKTTVTSLAASMLQASGRSCTAAGNIGLPLIEAAAWHDSDVIVAEVSSFQLAFTERFRPAVAAWINLAEDHLDWHGSFSAYVAAKARIFANQRAEDVAVANAEDPVTLAHAAASLARLVTFGGSDGEYRLVGDELVAPAGSLVAIADLSRRMPHDLANALAAAAVAMEAGASLEGCRAALKAWEPLAHRVAHVATLDGIAYYDDSKATTPSAVVAALSGFEAAVLIAGGRNKGLDLSPLKDAAVRDGRRVVHAVVAIGEAASEVLAAFAGSDVLLRRAHSMDEAVRTASCLARPGDVVLLSPGCASFDWYGSYAERGDDFARAVRKLASSPEVSS
jgi:UDP-N-acetylmuramoylalanine--D-glutamate ligase